MSFIHKAIWAAFKRAQPTQNRDTYTIKLHADGKYIHGLTIEDSTNGPRNTLPLPPEHRKGALGVLMAPGGVSFRTAKGKPFFIKFTEFSFVVNHQHQPQAEKPAPVTPIAEPVIQAAA